VLSAEKGCEADIRAQRIEGLGLEVLLPGGTGGPAGLRPTQDVDPSSGSSGGKGLEGGTARSTLWCDCLQHASLLAHFASLHGGRLLPRASGCGGNRNDDGGGAAGPGAVVSAHCWSLAELQDADKQLRLLLEAGGCELQRLLPTWRAHGFLVNDGAL
jgi:hypothetical protein